MSFESLNKELTEAQAELETAIRVVLKAEGDLELAEINLIQIKSAKTKARLELKLYQERVDSLRERSWNLRAEAKNLR